MRIAISTDGDYVAQHFGRCPTYTFVDIEDGQLVKLTEEANPGHEPGNIPRFLHEKGAKIVVCGGMGMRAQGFFNEFGIKTLVGIAGTIAETIEELKAGTLAGGESFCRPGAGKGFGIEKTECDHEEE